MPVPGVPHGSWLAVVLNSRLLGITGLDLFFVLSGFLIGGILLDTRDSTNYFRVFYVRRFFRIVPVYALLLLAVWIPMWFSPGFWLPQASHSSFDPSESYQPLPWLSYLLYVQNFAMVMHRSWGLIPLDVTWSLAVEEQFYLTLPLLIRFLSRRTLLRVVLGGILIAPFLRAVCDHLFPNNYLVWFTLLPCRIDALFVGVLVAILVREPRWRDIIVACRRVLAKHWALLLLALLIGGAGLGQWVSHAKSNQISSLMVSAVFSVVAILYALLLLNVLLFPSGWLGACFRWRWLRMLGLVSYGVYLSHTYIIFLFFHRGNPIMHSARELVSLLGVVVTVSLLCALSWRFFEKPLLLLGKRWQYHYVARASARATVAP
jgi:peptidoglycan/LPS O-acetylase OafA/YrhL